MNITDSILAAYRAGVSTKQEDKLIVKEMTENDNFSNMLDILDEVDAIEGMDELRNEFNETIDTNIDFQEIKSKIQ